MNVQPTPKKRKRSWQEYEDFGDMIETLGFKCNSLLFECIKYHNGDYDNDKICAYCTTCSADNKPKGKLEKWNQIKNGYLKLI